MKKLIYILLLVVIPLSFLALADTLVGLTLPSSEPFLPVPGENILIDNPNFISQYHFGNKQVTRTVQRNAFKSQRDSNERRILVIGESTAEGFPYQSNQSFSKLLQVSLQNLHPEFTWNVVNMGFSAMSSYFTADALNKILPYDFDLVIFYMGHNEFFGTINNLANQNHGLTQFFFALQKLNSVRWLRTLNSGDGKALESLMERQYEQMNALVTESSRTAALTGFQENLKGILQTLKHFKTPGIFIEPASNLFYSPFRDSQFSFDDWKTLVDSKVDLSSEKDLETFFDQKNLSKNTASFFFLKGIGLFKKGASGEDVYKLFTKAKDLDEVPFRGPTVFIESLRSIVEKETNVDLVHWQQKLWETAGVRGFSDLYFIDHLHYNLEGNKLLAETLVGAVENQFQLPASDAQEVEKSLEVYFQEVSSHPLFMAITDSLVKKLLTNKIFSGRTIPQAPVNVDMEKLNPEVRNFFVQFLTTDLKPGAQMLDVLAKYYNYLLSVNNHKEIETYLRLNQALFPGDPLWFEVAGRYYSQANPELSTALVSAGKKLRQAINKENWVSLKESDAGEDR